MSVAYLLIAHGSRDRRSQSAFAALVEQLKPHLHAATAELPTIGIAALELSVQPLHQQIVQFVHQAATQQTISHPTLVTTVDGPLSDLYLFPLFLLPGMHVREDIPAEVAQAGTLLTTDCRLHLCPYLGGQPGFVPLLRRLFSQLPASQRLLLAHGSRRFGGNAPIEAIAGRLNATPAYWAIAPSLAEQVSQLTAQGHQQLAIQPYFLFPGGITTAIEDEVNWLQKQFDTAQFQLGRPLCDAPEFIALVLDWLQRGSQVLQ
ncbi:MAG: CbiX/SirB N-terminal domain-containing protein [Cyanobacteria bacterium P01_G01_bin.54]